MNKPIKYYKSIPIEKTLKGDNILLINSFFKKDFVTAKDFEDISIAMKIENIYSIDWEIHEYYNSHSYGVSFYTKEPEESAEIRYQKDLKEYAIWLSKEEERLAQDAKKLGYKLVKEEK